METVVVEDPEIVGGSADAFEVISEKKTYRLAQKPASYVVLEFIRRVAKHKETGKISCPAAPPSVLPGSYADVSLLAGLLVDKFRYHLPLYRQHQRIADAGITVSRSSLSNRVHEAIGLLEPIYLAQLRSILESSVLAMDETPIRAGRKSKGKMRTGYYWPLFGDRGEVAVPYASTRSKPDRSRKAIEMIRALYEIEREIADRRREGLAKQKQRAIRSQPIVAEFFAWLEREMIDSALLPTNPFTKAAHYALDRQKGLEVFLANPKVPLDTNHLERALRPIPMGRKNWLFCWTEVGAEKVGWAQSLVSTCVLHDIDPYVYLVGVLQRIDSHPFERVDELTPRLWKEHFGDDPMRSRLNRG